MKKIKTVDNIEGEQLASPILAKEFREKNLKNRPEKLRVVEQLFTKEYDSRGRLKSIIPFFMDVMLAPKPRGAIVKSSYYIETGARVQVLEEPGNVGYIYHINLPEQNITISELRELYDELESFKQTQKTQNDILKRWYLSHGILDHLLRDKKVLEINVNPPAYTTSLRIVHSDFDECVSNIYPSQEALNVLATRLKIGTGRPLNKAQPQLDGEISVGKARARVAAIAEPFSVLGMGYSIRKHREDPWTLPLFMKNQMANEWFAGLMALAIAHGRTFLTAGPRGSGKTSLLGSLLLEILPKYRILTIEDTQELPIHSYKELGYDLLPLKVKSALLQEGMEMPFDTGLRTSLRLGDSCLIIGEIRSKEAKILYEAMRVGAMANVVAGTIHGDSPYGVFDRVVNDLEVPKGSFKVTDLIVIVNQIKSPTGLSRKRRVLSVTEVLKNWQDEPEFQDLLVYNPKSDQLEPTDNLLKGKSVLLQQILSRTKGYEDYNDILKDIRLRGWAKQVHVKLAEDAQLEAPYIAKANIIYTKLADALNPLKDQTSYDEFSKQFTQALKNMLDADSQDKEVKEELRKKQLEIQKLHAKYGDQPEIVKAKVDNVDNSGKDIKQEPEEEQTEQTPALVKSDSPTPTVDEVVEDKSFIGRISEFAKQAKESTINSFGTNNAPNVQSAIGSESSIMKQIEAAENPYGKGIMGKAKGTIEGFKESFLTEQAINDAKSLVSKYTGNRVQYDDIKNIFSGKGKASQSDDKSTREVTGDEKSRAGESA